MKMRKRMFPWVIMTMIMILLLAASCKTSTKQQTNTEPSPSETPKDFYKDPFFEKARFIMTKEEIEIYKHLPDKAAKETFIEEFWKKRDPTPETEENENKEEFEERITYANKWFKEHSKGRGWDTQRGRILLQLGFPDRREFGEADDVVRSGRPVNWGQLITSKRIPMEIWVYFKPYFVLVFADLDDSGRLELMRVPHQLPTALDRAKFSLDLRNQRNLKHAFRFKVEYQADHFQITIPVKKVTFEEKDRQMIVDFGITIYVYRNNKKVDEINTQKTFSMEKEKILERKTIKFDIPYAVSEKGKYHFDVVIEEKSSESKFRDFTKYKL